MMDKKKRANILADHPFVVILGIIASILGILGYNLRDIWLPSSSEQGANTSSITSSTSRETDTGWVEEITIYPAGNKKTILYTLIPTGRTYELVRELNLILNLEPISPAFLTFEASSYDGTQYTPIIFQVSQPVNDPQNLLLEAIEFSKSYSTNWPSRSRQFFISEGDTLFVINPREGYTRIHIKTLSLFTIWSKESKVVMIISFSKNSPRFDNLLSP